MIQQLVGSNAAPDEGYCQTQSEFAISAFLAGQLETAPEQAQGTDADTGATQRLNQERGTPMQLPL